jgi:proteasome beta subunit
MDVDDDAMQLSTGTTIAAVATTEGVVIGADRRASLGGQFVAATDMEKLDQVHPTGVVAIAGSVSHGQSFVRQLRGQVDRYRMNRGREPTARALSRIASRALAAAPRHVRPLLGIVDESGSYVYSLDGAGGSLSSSHAARGSGMQLAYSVLDSHHEPDSSLADARETVSRAIDAATERDTASGNGMTIATITGDSVEMETVSPEELTAPYDVPRESGGEVA